MTINAFLPVGAIASTEHADTLLELAFLVTAADGKIETAELFGDRLLIPPEDAGMAVDSQAVRYFELPLPR
jgi:hypothetical protein